MTRGALALPDAVRRAILRHARAARPRECCGFLLGRDRTVQFAAGMRNASGGRTTYRIDDRDHIDVRRLLRNVSPALEIVGVYHSHPDGPARPSETDIAGAHYPEWVHVIVGLSPKAELRAYRIARGRAVELRVRLISSED